MRQPLAISFPRMGGYDLPIQALIGELLPGQRVFPAPPITAKTIELGSRHSPDFVCAPFKYNLGNYIQSLEAGANLLIQTGMGCRYGYYGELQEQILRDLGYSFRFLCFSRERARPGYLCRALRELGTPLSLPRIAHVFAKALYRIRVMDRLEYRMRLSAGLEQTPGSHAAWHEEMRRAIGSASSLIGIDQAGRDFARRQQAIPLREDSPPLRVGLVGELYTLMEPLSNFELERELIRQGISVSRRMSVSFLLFGRRGRSAPRETGGYLRHPAGANGTDSVAQAKRYMEQGYDGIIHMKSFGCTPELNVIPALQNLSKAYGVPVLHLSFDSHTSEVGVQTRLEAFGDMIAMRRRQADEAQRQLGGGCGLHLHQRRGVG